MKIAFKYRQFLFKYLSNLPTNVDNSHQLYPLVSPQVMIVKTQMRRLRKSQSMTVTKAFTM